MTPLLRNGLLVAACVALIVVVVVSAGNRKKRAQSARQTRKAVPGKTAPATAPQRNSASAEPAAAPPVTPTATPAPQPTRVAARKTPRPIPASEPTELETLLAGYRSAGPIERGIIAGRIAQEGTPQALRTLLDLATNERDTSAACALLEAVSLCRIVRESAPEVLRTVEPLYAATASVDVKAAALRTFANIPMPQSVQFVRGKMAAENAHPEEKVAGAESLLCLRDMNEDLVKPEVLEDAARALADAALLTTDAYLREDALQLLSDAGTVGVNRLKSLKSEMADPAVVKFIDDVLATVAEDDETT